MYVEEGKRRGSAEVSVFANRTTLVTPAEMTWAALAAGSDISLAQKSGAGTQDLSTTDIELHVGLGGERLQMGQASLVKNRPDNWAFPVLNVHAEGLLRGDETLSAMRSAWGIGLEGRMPIFMTQEKDLRLQFLSEVGVLNQRYVVCRDQSARGHSWTPGCNDRTEGKSSNVQSLFVTGKVGMMGHFFADRLLLSLAYKGVPIEAPLVGNEEMSKWYVAVGSKIW